MRGDTRKFLSEALGSDQATYSPHELYSLFLRTTGRESGASSESHFRGMMGRISDRGLAVSIFRGCWIFPAAEIMVRLSERYEAPWIIASDGLRRAGYEGNIGGFDILYDSGEINVPPVRKVIFASCRSMIHIRGELRRYSGNSISLDMTAVPRTGAGQGPGLEKRLFEKTWCCCSTPGRAREEALWLARSSWGKKTGLSGQEMLIGEMDEENTRFLGM